MANEQGRVRLVSDESPPAYRDERADYIYCLDLKFISPESAGVWIAEARHAFHKYDSTKVPTVVALGDYGQLRRHGYRLVKAGAILWEKPDEFDDFEEEQKVTFLENEFSYPEKERPHQFYESEKGDGDWLLYENTREGREEEGDESSAGPQPHLHSYVDPPYQLGSEDFRRLMDRMRMSDDDPRKDD